MPYICEVTVLYWMSYVMTYLAFKGADYIVFGVESVPEYVVRVLNGGRGFWGSAPAY